MSEEKHYAVKQVRDEFKITGQGTDRAWEEINWMDDFTLPWNDEKPQVTRFKALWSEQNFYFLFDVDDDDIVAPGEDGDKLGVLPSDRVEIFFKSKGSMNPYYCLELDPRGRVLDYIANYYRKFDFEWEWPDEGLEVLAHYTENGYTVEGRISLESLREFAIIDQDGKLEAGLFRGDYYHSKDEKTDVKWISWQIPQKETPDFHIPSAFGVFSLVNWSDH